jgi:hypothetical protein
VTPAGALALASALLLAAGCGGSDEAAPASWQGLPQPLPADGTVPVEGFSDFSESVDEAWERTPAAVAAVFAAPRDVEARVSVSVPARPGGASTATADVVVDGLADDSVRALRYELALERVEAAVWRVVSATWSQRCQPGRGHQEFSAALCV